MQRCPYRLFGLGICLKEQCPKWVKLTNNVPKGDKIEQVEVGQCSEKWIPELMTEITGVLNRIEGKK